MKRPDCRLSPLLSFSLLQHIRIPLVRSSSLRAQCSCSLLRLSAGIEGAGEASSASRALMVADGGRARYFLWQETLGARPAGR